MVKAALVAGAAKVVVAMETRVAMVEAATEEERAVVATVAVK